MARPLLINLTSKTIFTVIGVLMCIYFIFAIRHILALIFIAFILMAAMRPLSRFLTRLKIPGSLSHLLALLMTLTILFLVILLIIPPLVGELFGVMRQFDLSDELDSVVKSLHLTDINNLQYLSSPLEALPKVIQFISSVMIFPLRIVIVFLLAFTLLGERQELWRTSQLFGANPETQNRVKILLDRIETKLSAWIVGELTLMIVVGGSVALGLTLLGVKYALALGVIAGLFEIVPTIGPILSVIPAFLVAVISGSWPEAIGVIILFLFIHQGENHVIVPLIMKRAVGLSPVITIPLLLIGTKLAGPAGAILAVPLALTFKIITVEIYHFITEVKHPSVTIG